MRFKDFMFWRMLINSIAVITKKPIRKALIDFLGICNTYQKRFNNLQDY